MPWFNVDDGFAFHRKALRAGNAAIGLWTRAGSYCAQQLTDGHVPQDIVTTLGTEAQAKRLVAAGLWTAVEDGYQFWQWNEDKRNPTRKEVLAKRAKEAERKAKGRAAQKNGEKNPTGQPYYIAPKGRLTKTEQNEPFSEEPQVNGSCPRGVREVSQGESQGESVLSPPLPSLKTKELQDPRSMPPVSNGRGASGPNSTAAFRLVRETLGDELTSATRTALAIEVATLLPEVDTTTIAGALNRWNNRSGIGPRMLPGLVDDIRKEARGATNRPPVANGFTSATDEFAAAFLAGKTTPTQLRALPGGA